MKDFGKFALQGIPPAPRGEPQIKVTFAVGADGEFSIRATEEATGRAITIQSDNASTSGTYARVSSGPEEVCKPFARRAPDDSEVVSLLRGRGRSGHIQAVRLWRQRTGQGLKESVDAVNRIANAYGLPVEDKGCFVATVCFGDSEAREVLELRNFRDSALEKNAPGRLAVRLYYAFSPPLARWLAKSPRTAAFFPGENIDVPGEKNPEPEQVS